MSNHERGQPKIDLENMTAEEIKEQYSKYLEGRRQRQKEIYKKLKADPEKKKLQDEKRRAYQNAYYEKNKEKFKLRNAENREKAKLKKESEKAKLKKELEKNENEN
jgi:hypothetical protein